MYYSYEEPVDKIVPHRILALNRGEKEGILRVAIKPDIEFILKYLNKKWIRNSNSFAASIVSEAIEDGYKRLIQPSIEREIHSELTERGRGAGHPYFFGKPTQFIVAATIKRKSGSGSGPCLSDWM